MVIRYKGFYVDELGDTVKVSMSVDLPSASHLDSDFKIISYVNFYLPRWINPLDCSIDITICDNHRNKFHDYRFHNGHYAKYMHNDYFWLDSSNQVTGLKDLGSYPKVLDPTEGSDIQATIDLAKRLWHIS